MHPFTSLTLWALAACTTLILPTQTILPVYSAATFFCLIALKATRRRAKYVVWLMFSLGAGLWLVHGGWLTEWLSGTPRSPERWAHAITLWLRILAIVSTSQLWMQYVPVQRFIRALFASRLPPGVAYLFAGPLLVVEQLKRQLAIIHEAQRARGVPLDEELVSAFTCDARVNYSANTQCAKRSCCPWCGAGYAGISNQQ